MTGFSQGDYSAWSRLTWAHLIPEGPGKACHSTNTGSDWGDCRWQAGGDGGDRGKADEELNETWDCLSRKELNWTER